MISMLTGKVVALEPGCIVLDVGGVGFCVHLAATYRERLPVGDVVTIFARLVVRQEALTLYGFETQESREFFDLLLGVSGIGPRLALSVLSTLSTDAIRRAVFHEQVDVFSRVPGIGKKNAQKILLHLQDRLPSVDGLAPAATMSDVDTEVLGALTTLGYSVVEAQAALQYIPRDAAQDVETRLRLALQYFTSP